MNQPRYHAGLHVYAAEDTIRRFKEGYISDKNFAVLYNHARNENADEQKYRAYHIGRNGLLYFEDADQKIRLCVPEAERNKLIQEVHDGVHEGVHARWERSLSSLRERFYWPRMRTDTIEHVKTCNPCQKIKHDRGARMGFLVYMHIQKHSDTCDKM